MVSLLMDLAVIECRIATLSAAGRLEAELAHALARAEYYLQLRASEANETKRSPSERRRRFRAWLRGAA
jgi:hypothetical protein